MTNSTFKSIVTKSLMCSAVVLATVGSAVDTPAFAEPPLSVATCPALEGYPDCHPDARTSRTLWLRADQQEANLKRGSARLHHFRAQPQSRVPDDPFSSMILD